METPITTIEALAAMSNTHMASKEDIKAVTGWTALMGG